jgi:hypothetical protein
MSYLLLLLLIDHFPPLWLADTQATLKCGPEVLPEHIRKRNEQWVARRQLLYTYPARDAFISIDLPDRIRKPAPPMDVKLVMLLNKRELVLILISIPFETSSNLKATFECTSRFVSVRRPFRLCKQGRRCKFYSRIRDLHERHGWDVDDRSTLCQ